MSAEPATATADGLAIRAHLLTKCFRVDPASAGKLRTFLNPKLSFSAADVTALRAVTFDLAPGEALGVIGENGAGKSTLLRLLASISDPTTGFAEVNGRVASLLSFDAGFHPDLTGRDNVERQCALLGLSSNHARKILPHILEFSELESAIDRPLKTYSAGMRVRLGFALATRLDADILLFDEILLVGDENFQRKCVSHIKALREERAPTIVFASHALGAVRSFCERTLWLENGETREIGESWTVTQNYQDHLRLKAAMKPAHELHPVGGPTVPEVDGAGRRSELSIREVEILGADGQPKERLRCGDPLRLRVHYTAEVAVPRPNFGLALYRNDGVLVFGTSSAKDGVSPESVPVGEGTFEIHLPALPLLPGTYEITLACFDAADQYKYDYQHRRWRFEVERGGREDGLVRLPHEWKF